MNRCFRLITAPHHVLRTAIVSSALLALDTGALAQEAVRPFPAAAKRATLPVTYPPEIMLNGQSARLSPGARIRSVNNLLVLSGTLVGQSVVVNYVQDGQGMVHEVWILNATEARQSRDGANAPSDSK